MVDGCVLKVIVQCERHEPGSVVCLAKADGIRLGVFHKEGIVSIEGKERLFYGWSNYVILCGFDENIRELP